MDVYDFEENCNDSHNYPVFLPCTYNQNFSFFSFRALAGDRVKAEMAVKEHEIQLAGSAVESAVLLLWTHMEHFLFYGNANAQSSMNPYQRAYRGMLGEFGLLLFVVFFCLQYKIIQLVEVFKV